MKLLVLLGCAGLVVACGSSSGTRVDGTQAPPLPMGAPQVPQQPTNSVPPVNSQTAPLNSQQAPLNPQQAPLSPEAAVTCDQVATAARAAGCTLNNQDFTDCAKMNASSLCWIQYQGLLWCLTRNVVCDANGDLNLSTCTAELTTFARCMEVSQATCVSPSCNNCSDACSRCECRMIANGNLNCTNECAVTN